MPIRDAAALEAARSELAKELAEAHVALSRKLEKPGCRPDAREELLRALAHDPEHAWAREKLGWKRVEVPGGASPAADHRWEGTPLPPQASRGKPDAALVRERANLRHAAAARLVRLGARALAGGLEKEARALAGLALDEDPLDREARLLAGQALDGADWISPREKRLREAFRKASGAVPRSTPASGVEDLALAKLLGAELVRRDGPTASFYASKAAVEGDLEPLGRALEVTRRSYRYFLLEGDEGFAVEGEPAAAPVSTRTSPNRPRWLLLAPKEHAAFVEKVVAEKPRQDLAKRLRSWSGYVEPEGAGKLFVFETCLDAAHRPEWVVLNAVKTLLVTQTGAKAPCPGFLVEGLTRFFDGRVTGRAELSYVSTHETSSQKDRKAVSFEELRGTIRAAWIAAPEGELRRLASKTLNDLDDRDSALALAFVEWALDQHRAGLRAFLGSLDPQVGVPEQLEKALGAPLDSLERELRAWVRVEL